ncbi:MAG: hypothetical protein DMG40_24825 [Acidobacteria bacterium]|nr:MAG: hypothetical protein DMG40_24825 [Acidobacteriota bacterium]
MARLLQHTILLTLGLSLPIATLPGSRHAQLVRENGKNQARQAPAAQNGSKSQPAYGKKRVSQEVQITGDASWMDTGVDVQPGEHVVMSATGKLRYSDAKEDNGPDGLARGFRDLLRVLPLNDAGRGALIGRIGDKDAAQPFLVGAHCDVVAPITGRLALGINQESKDPATGTYVVLIEVYAPADGEAHVVVAKSIASIPGIDNGLFSKIPRRVSDKQGHPGDMVNLLILGSASAMRNAFLAAGWVQVDADVKDAVLHGIIESMSHESYLNMPMSQLYLFGRPQDYGWAHAEPLYVAKSRNHLRIWKAPIQVHGETLWVGAATHDIGIERDQRNNGITHKIDPDIDLERDYVEKTLCSTGLVSEIAYFLPENPLKEAKTATGGSFHSDGKVLVLKLVESSAKR